MTLNPSKHCCSAQLLHGCSKRTGPAGTCHSAWTNKPSQNPQSWGKQHKAVLKLCALEFTSLGYGQIEHGNWGDSAAQRSQFKDYGVGWFCIKLAQLYRKSG